MPDLKYLVFVKDPLLLYADQYKLFSDPKQAIEHAKKHGYGTGMLGMSFLGGELKPGFANMHQGGGGPLVMILALEVQEPDTPGQVHVAMSQHSFDSPPEILGMFRTIEGAVKKVHERFLEPWEEDEIEGMMDPDLWDSYEEITIAGETKVKSFKNLEDGGGAWVETHTLETPQ